MKEYTSEEIKDSASFDSRFGNANIICEIVRVEENDK